jgi:cobalt/nickel transport system permease protein
MHISDGIIGTELSVVALAVSGGLIYISTRNTTQEEVPRMGIIAAALFAVSTIHIPLAGTSVHPGLYGLAGIILGRRSIPVIFTVLIFQALIFQHGGLLSLGVNTLNMSAGALAAWKIWELRRFPVLARAGLAGFFGIIIPVVLMAGEFMLSGYGTGITYFFSVYLLAGLLEGVLTLSSVKFLLKVKPEVIA